jgi:hypothetical protein
MPIIMRMPTGAELYPLGRGAYKLPPRWQWVAVAIVTALTGAPLLILLLT